MKKVFILICSLALLVCSAVSASAVTLTEDYLWINGYKCFLKSNMMSNKSEYFGDNPVVVDSFVRCSAGSEFDFMGEKIIVSSTDTESTSYKRYTLTRYNTDGTTSEMIATEKIDGGALYLGIVYYTSNSNLYVQMAYTDTVSYWGAIGLSKQITDPDFSEPSITMTLVNFSDVMTEDAIVSLDTPVEAYVHIEAPVAGRLICEYGSGFDSSGNLVYGSVGDVSFLKGSHNFTVASLGVEKAGNYRLLLYDKSGNLQGIRLFKLPETFIQELCMTLHDIPASGENISSSFGILVNNPMLEAGRLEVFNTKLGSTVKTIYLLTFNGLSTGFGNAFEYTAKKTLDLNFTDLGLMEVGSYEFRLYDEENNLVDSQTLSVSGFNYAGSNYGPVGGVGGTWSENGTMTDYDFSGIFEYPEIAEDAGIIDYIKWICACLIITLQSIVQIIQNFILACASFTAMIGRFFSFLPTEFAVMLPILLAVCIIARVLSR